MQGKHLTCCTISTRLIFLGGLYLTILGLSTDPMTPPGSLLVGLRGTIWGTMNRVSLAVCKAGILPAVLSLLPRTANSYDLNLHHPYHTLLFTPLPHLPPNGKLTKPATNMIRLYEDLIGYGLRGIRNLTTQALPHNVWTLSP